MESLTPEQQDPAGRRRRVLTAFAIYGAMTAAFLGLAALFSDDNAFEAQAQLGGMVAAKPGRYEAVIANWNRYRSINARAEAPLPQP